MIIFGIDIPLVEIIFGLTIIMFIILVEIIIITAMLAKQMKESKKMSKLLHQLSNGLLALKKVEIQNIRNKEK